MSSQPQGWEQWKINQFLERLGDAIAEKRIQFWRNPKNLDFLARYGMHPGERIEILKTLKANDFDSGPEDDINNPGDKDIWIFSKKYLGITIYIKIKLKLVEDKHYAICYSFHEKEKE